MIEKLKIPNLEELEDDGEDELDFDYNEESGDEGIENYKIGGYHPSYIGWVHEKATNIFLPKRGDGRPLHRDPEARVGPLLDGVAGQGPQARHVRGPEDPEELAALLGSGIPFVVNFPP